MQCFTVREIAASVKAFSKGMNIYDTIMTIYGARYTKELKEKLNDLLRKYDSFKNIQPDVLNLPENFPNCFQNRSILQAIKSIKFALNNNRHIIISGNEGSGKTQLALWVAEWYIGQNNLDKSNIFYCLCTEELKCPDLIGRQSPTNKSEPGEELIEWTKGFLSNAVENGGIVVLDDLNQATTTVTERLNGLLDQKCDETKEAKFDIPENPQEPEIVINPKFRLICTSDINKINQMSPAFVNRFDIIVLEDQLECLNENEKKELIKFLLKNSLKEENYKKKFEKENKNEEEVINGKENEKIFHEVNAHKYENIKNYEENKSDDENDEENENIEKENEEILNNLKFEDEPNEEGENEDNEYNNEGDNNSQDEEHANIIQKELYGEEQDDEDNFEKNEDEISEKREQDEIIEYNNEIEVNEKNKEDDIIEVKEFNPNQEIIEYIYKKLKDFDTIYKLNKFCRTIRIFISKFKNEKEITLNSIAEFC